MGKNKNRTIESQMLTPDRINKILRDCRQDKPTALKAESITEQTKQRDDAQHFCRAPVFDEDMVPEDTIRSFVKFSEEVVSRFEENERLIVECDAQTQDILHFIELSDDLGVIDGFDVYELLRDVRRKRRKCKNDNDYLRAAYEYCESNRQVFTQLSGVQGRTKSAKAVIEAKQYSTRTNVLNGLRRADIGEEEQPYGLGEV